MKEMKDNYYGSIDQSEYDTTMSLVSKNELS